MDGKSSSYFSRVLLVLASLAILSCSCSGASMSNVRLRWVRLHDSAEARELTELVDRRGGLLSCSISSMANIVPVWVRLHGSSSKASEELTVLADRGFLSGSCSTSSMTNIVLVLVRRTVGMSSMASRVLTALARPSRSGSGSGKSVFVFVCLRTGTSGVPSGKIVLVGCDLRMFPRDARSSSPGSSSCCAAPRSRNRVKSSTDSA
mmetsp:Transcript_62814/g.182219  ORF Transcript_62814/g.182219 Transcript_62814/m.182219 type:complete len:206 (+) Transcript_62814:429-1046(+)